MDSVRTSERGVVLVFKNGTEREILLTRKNSQWAKRREADQVVRDTMCRRIQEGLYRVLDDAAQPPEQRAAAAYVLRLRVPEEALARIRIAADAAADLELKGALKALGAGSDEEADASLTKLATRVHA